MTVDTKVIEFNERAYIVEVKPVTQDELPTNACRITDRYTGIVVYNEVEHFTFNDFIYDFKMKQNQCIEHWGLSVPTQPTL